MLPDSRGGARADAILASMTQRLDSGLRRNDGRCRRAGEGRYPERPRVLHAVRTLHSQQALRLARRFCVSAAISSRASAQRLDSGLRRNDVRCRRAGEGRYPERSRVLHAVRTLQGQHALRLERRFRFPSRSHHATTIPSAHRHLAATRHPYRAHEKPRARHGRRRRHSAAAGR